MRYDRPLQDQYGDPVYNRYQPLEENGDHYPNESFLGKDRDGYTCEIRTPESEEEEPDEGYRKKRGRED